MSRDADSVAAEMTRQAIALVDDLFPARQKASELPDDVRVPIALLARCVSIAKTNLHLAELDTQMDAYVCLRTLYEHTVMLAWLLGPQIDGQRTREGGRRLLLWERHCDQQIAKLNREMAAANGESRISGETQAAIDAAAAVDLGATRMPNLADMAVQADRDWDERVRTVDPDRSFLLPLRDSYSRTYRPASAMAHPTFAGIRFLTTRTEGEVEIHLERHDPTLPVLPAVPVFLAMAYLATAHFIREPSLNAVAALIRCFHDQ